MMTLCVLEKIKTHTWNQQTFNYNPNFMLLLIPVKPTASFIHQRDTGKGKGWPRACKSFQTNARVSRQTLNRLGLFLLENKWLRGRQARSCDILNVMDGVTRGLFTVLLNTSIHWWAAGSKETQKKGFLVLSHLIPNYTEPPVCLHGNFCVSSGQSSILPVVFRVIRRSCSVRGEVLGRQEDIA